MRQAAPPQESSSCGESSSETHSYLVDSNRMSFSPALLDLRNIEVKRGNKTVLENFSLHVQCGEHVAILGPNGCGKSTLIKTITRECYPVAQPNSSIRILGEECWNVFNL